MAAPRLTEQQRKVLLYLSKAEHASLTSIAEHALGRPRTNHGRVSIANVEPTLYALCDRGFVRQRPPRIWRIDSKGSWGITDKGRAAVR